METLRRGFPGMKSVKDLPSVQDGPPPGGYPSVRYGRKLPSTGPAGVTLFAVATALLTYGLYKVGQGNKERRRIKEEKMTARRAMVPALQAEEDRRWLKAMEDFKKLEADVMKDVPGWKAGEGWMRTRSWSPVSKPIGIMYD